MARMVASKCFTQIRNTSLPCVEGFAVGNSLLRRLPNEIRRTQITLPDPQRNQALFATTVIGYGNDAAFR